jgi:cysteine synthase
VPEEFRLTLGEGATDVTRAPFDANILLKREDTNPTGSHKDRAASYQLAAAAARGDRAVTISSSGNAGIATSRYAELHRLPAYVFVHPTTQPEKIDAIDGATTTLVTTQRAINSAKLVARELRIPNLRPSVNDDALCGYSTLGDELSELNVDAVVLFATSGATALAVAQRLADVRPNVQVHVVQGEGNAAIVAPESTVDDVSARGAAAGRLGVRRTRRTKQLREAIAASGGAGHVATSADIDLARTKLRDAGIDAGDESCANVSVAMKLSAQGMRVACVVSGAPPEARGQLAAARIDAADEHEAFAAIEAQLAGRGAR